MARDKRPGLHCQRCGEFIPVPLGEVGWVVGVIKLFVKAHKQCRVGGERIMPICTFQIESGPGAAKFGRF